MKILIFLLSLLLCGNNHGYETQNDNKITVNLNISELMQPYMSSNIKREVTSPTKYTMITYVDKNDCPLCFVCHLHEWEIFMKECKENEIPIEFLFIFCPPEAGDVIFMNTLASSSISHLSYIDVKNEFRKKNQWLINNPAKHRFIIDKEKKPVFMEEPPYNKEIMMWLRSLTQGKRA